MSEKRVVAVIPADNIDVDALVWFQYGGMSCSICGHTYADVEDMNTREVVRSNEPPDPVEIACERCFRPPTGNRRG